MARNDVILTTLHRVGADYVADFIASLKATGYDGHIVFFASRMPPESVARLRQQNITVVPSGYCARGLSQRLASAWPLWRWIFSTNATLQFKEKIAHRVFHLFYLRHLLYLQFLRERRAEFGRVFLTDGRDVFFQADPFSWNPSPGVHFFLEENQIGACPHNSTWIRSQFGEATLSQLAQKTVSCAGTTFGDITGILEYLALMVSWTMRVRSLSEIAGDQGVHNYLVHQKLLTNATIHENRRGPVFTMGPMKMEQVQLNSAGQVINDNKQVVPVLHQYDRIPELSGSLLNRSDRQGRKS